MHLAKRQHLRCENKFLFNLTLLLIAWISSLFISIAYCFSLETPPNKAIGPGAGFEQPASSMTPAYFSALPLSFESNQGQTAAKKGFLARGPGYTLFLSADQAVFKLRSGIPQYLDPADLSSTCCEPKNKIADDAVLQMHIVNANPDALAEELESLSGKVNYFKGNDPAHWHTNISTHSRVRYNEVYPGIDLEYYGNQGQLEFDFVVSAGSDPTQIRLAFDGSESIEIEKNGDLMIHTANGIIRQLAPLAYQEIDGKRNIVTSRFIRHDSPGAELQRDLSDIGFEIGPYDTSQKLVIDPALVYGTFLGGSYFDTGYAVVTDASGNIYLSGEAMSSDFPTINPYQTTLNNQRDAFVTKISSDGSTVIYSTFLGGSGFSEAAKAIAVDSNGAAYIVGSTDSTNFPTTSGAYQETPGSSNHAFVVKLAAGGNALEYSTYLSGDSTDYGNGIAVDSSGNAYVTGYTASTDFPTQNALYANSSGNFDAFVTQLNPAGTALVYSTYLGSSDLDKAENIAIDDTGNAYITGYTAKADNFPTASGSYAVSGGGYDVFVSKVGAGGSSLIYSTVFGGSSTDYAHGIAVDESSKAYITGKTYSANFPIVGAYQDQSGGQYDAFLAVVSDDGSDLAYSSFIGGSQEDIGYAVAVDSDGTAYITGSTKSTDFPVKRPFLEGRSYGGGSYDAFVSRFDLSQTGENSLVYSVFQGGTGNDFGRAITSSGPGKCYVVGETNSTDLPLIDPLSYSLTTNNYGTVYSSAFIIKIVDDQAYADLVVTMDDLPPVEVGEDFSYQIHVKNNGSETATGVALTNTLPAEVIFVSAASTQGTPVHITGAVTLDIGTINYSDTVTMTVTVTAPLSEMTLINVAEVNGTSSDPSLTNNFVSKETLVRSQYYSFNFYNYNFLNTHEPSCGSVSSTPAGIDCNDGDCSADFLEDTVLQLTATFPDDCVFVQWSGGDGYPACGSTDGDCIATVGDGSWAKAEFRWLNADLSLSGEDQPDVSMISGTVNYNLTLENIGTDGAESLVLVDTLPPEAIYVSSTISSGSCSYNDTVHQLTCQVNYLGSNQQVDVTITVTAPATVGTITNQATVSNNINDRDPSNNAITETTTITDQQQMLNVVKTGDGTGIVASTLAGIDCGVDCGLFPKGSTVTLLPAPDRGSFFTGWSGGECSGMGSCVVFLDADKTVTATFTSTPPATVALPKTGQATCFDDTGIVVDCAGTGQDGEIQAGMLWPDPRFEITYCDGTGPCAEQSEDCDGNSHNDTITDHLTGLIWSRSSDLASGTVTWQQALDTVSSLNGTTGLGGYSDWRVPNINELASLLLHQKGGYQVHSWLSDQGFIISHYSWIWSSTTYFDISYGGNNAFSMGLQLSDLQYFSKTELYNNRVWAVRGLSSGPTRIWKTNQTLCYDTDGATIDCAGTGQDGEVQAGTDWPNPRFSVIFCDSSGPCDDQSNDCDTNENTDMVRDNLTGIILTRNANQMAGTGNLQAARDRLATINGDGLGGSSDWRLPNIYELFSLIDFTSAQPSIINDHPFTNVMPYNRYWSSNSADLTSCSDGNCANLAYTLSFFNGRIQSGDKIGTSSYLWPVRQDTGSADLIVSMSDSSDPVRVNGPLTYSINVFNNGPGPGNNVTLVDTLPPGVSFVSAGSSQGFCEHSAGVVTCALADIASNVSATVSIQVSVGTTPAIINNSATVTTNSHDPDLANNATTETTHVSNVDYTLAVSKSGTGSGSVISTPVGIDCGNSCSHDFFETTNVTLEATADGSSLFIGWDGCDQASENQCSVTMDSNHTITALFDAVTTANYFVDSTGNDNNSGLGWSRPFKTIDKALSVAASGQEIWVRAGTYQPPVTNETYKQSFFALYKKVSLYGGFDGSETARNQRNWETNETTIDAHRDGYYGQGFYVNTNSDTGPGVQARIDGFVIRGGFAMGTTYPINTGGGVIVYSGSPIIANSEIKFNYAYSGGGIGAGSGTTIINCKVHHNNATNYGGGVQGNGSVKVINSTIYANNAYGGGGIGYWGGGSIHSSTIAGNTSSSVDKGAGVYDYQQGTTTITNSIIWGNSHGDLPSEISIADNASANVSYSNVRGGYAGSGNIDSDPVFVDVSSGDLKVQPFALSINAGNNSGLPADSSDLDEDSDNSELLPLDINRYARITDTTVDMGAYEYLAGRYDEYTLSVGVTPSGAATFSVPGVTCGNSCSVNYYDGTKMTIEALPTAPYRFAYWVGCDSSNRLQCNMTIDAAKIVNGYLVEETADSEPDGMLDWWEWHYFESLGRDGTDDFDDDSLSDKEEFDLGTNPDNKDTDEDGMPDEWEVRFGFNPTDKADAGGDEDGDGNTNLEEYNNGTNPVPLCGDISDDTLIDLTDLIQALQVLSGFDMAPNPGGDCNDDRVIGMTEALSILQKIDI